MAKYSWIKKVLVAWGVLPKRVYRKQLKVAVQEYENKKVVTKRKKYWTAKRQAEHDAKIAATWTPERRAKQSELLKKVLAARKLKAAQQGG